MRVLRSLIVAFAVLVSPVAATATSYCGGTLTHLLVEGNGHLWAKLTSTSDYVYVCNMESAVNSVNPRTCAMFYSQLVLAYTNGKYTVFRFNGLPDGTSCSGVPAWNINVATSYVQVY
jgi:hypothetical protein